MPQVLDGPINDSGHAVKRVHLPVCGDCAELGLCLKGALTQPYQKLDLSVGRASDFYLNSPGTQIWAQKFQNIGQA